jgi:hypothetical protein
MYRLNFLSFNSHNMYEWRMQPKCCARQASKVTLLRMYEYGFFMDPSFGAIPRLSLGQPEDTRGGSALLLAKLTLAIEVCEAFPFRRKSQTLRRQQVRLRGCVVGIGMGATKHPQP